MTIRLVRYIALAINCFYVEAATMFALFKIKYNQLKSNVKNHSTARHDVYTLPTVNKTLNNGKSVNLSADHYKSLNRSL